MTLSLLENSWTCKDITNRPTLLFSHLEIDPVIIIGMICIFSQLCYLFLYPRECLTCFHTASSCHISVSYLTEPLKKPGDLQKLVSRYLIFDNILKSLTDVSVCFRHMPILSALCSQKRQGCSKMKWIVQAGNQNRGRLESWRTLMTSPHIRGGPRKGGTGQTIAHALVDRKQWAEIRIYKKELR